MNTENKNSEIFKLAYETNMKMAIEFWEWRHKILTRFFITLGSLLILTGWLYKEGGTFHQYQAIPLLIGSLLSYFFMRLDIRNDDILKSCYKIGAELENKYIESELIFSKLYEFKENKKTYHYLLKILYGGSSAVLLLFSIIIFFQL